MGGSRYDEHLSSWLRAGWTLEDFHVVAFEALVRDVGGVYEGVLTFLGLDAAAARNLSSAETAPANRRSAAPYNVSEDAYRALVDAVADDARSLEKRLQRDFGWRRTWDAQLAQCARDGGRCRVSLLPGVVAAR